MEDYIGKICPFCKTEIKEGEPVKVCPECGIPHHESCWKENKGCTTFGCKEQHYEERHTSPTDVCVKCGAPLEEDQMFCPKCGTPKGGPKKNVCSKCGAELQEGQNFCPKCGQKVGLAVDAGVSSAISQFNSDVQKANEKKKKSSLIIGIVALIVVGIAVLFMIGNKPDFRKMFKDISRESWCTIAADGSYMKIDTNPKDIDEYIELEAHEKISDINKRLGFSLAVFDKMGHTRALDGRQSESNRKFTVSWTYHPNSGLEVIYERKR